jgi:iron complex transport system substrate-binding protein
MLALAVSSGLNSIAGSFSRSSPMGQKQASVHVFSACQLVGRRSTHACNARRSARSTRDVKGKDRIDKTLKAIFRRAVYGVFSSFLLFSCVECLLAKKVTDEVGRTVEVPDDPQRIVSLAPSITETLFDLGLESRIVGVTDYCDFPAAAQLKPRVGGIINPSLERIIALKPDLLFVTSEANKFEILAQMAKLHVPVFATSPRSIEGVFKSIRLLGEVTNTRSRAEELVNQLEARRARVLEKVKGLNRPRVLILYDLKPIVAGGKHTYPTDLIQTAGGTSITGGLEQDWPRLNIEFIVENDPEIIFLTPMYSGSAESNALRSLSGWKLTSAVRQNKIYTLDDRINHPSPRIIDVLEMLAERIHPEASGK